MDEKPRRFQMQEGAQCPVCGEKRGVRTARKRERQRYTCRACDHSWMGTPPTPPERPCPYCHGYCLKHATRLVKGRKPHLTPLQQWLGYESEPKPKRVQLYICTECGRINTELWPESYPQGKPRGVAPGPCRYSTDILLDWRSEDALVAYCRKRKLQLSEGMRQIFRAASYYRYVTSSGVHGKPPVLPPDTPTPPLPDKRAELWERKRGKLWGHREVFIVRRFNLKMDAAARLGLLRTMLSKNMSRQEAARYLIMGTEPKFTMRAGHWEE